MRLEVAQDLVRARAYGRCEGCGAFGGVQVHHRAARQAGGTGSRAAEERLSSPTNLLALCTSCHDRTEDGQLWQECVVLGWRIGRQSLAEPAEVPVLIHTVNGFGWWYLTEDGGYLWADLPDEHRICV